jgi:hypothetical protein
MEFAKLEFPQKENEPEQFFCTPLRTVPFMAWMADTRPNLGIEMLRQAMSTSPIKGTPP